MPRISRALLARFLPARYTLPFFIVVLLGVVVYLGSMVGASRSEQRSVEALIRTSDPTGVFSLPSRVASKKWKVFSFGAGRPTFRYPEQWRIASDGTSALIRDGAGAVLSLDSVGAKDVGESMLAYRVARLSALQDARFSLGSVEQATIGGMPSLVITFASPNTMRQFYEAAFLRDGAFYVFSLGIKQNAAGVRETDIISEFRQMLATVSVP